MRTLAVIVLVIAAQLALLRSPREHTYELHATRVVVAPIPTPLPIERVIHTSMPRAPCPPPRRDVSRGVLVQPPEPVDLVRPAATNTGWIAAWNAEHVYVSTDAGASWQRHFDGEGAVRDVGFDCFGRAIVVRGNRIGIDTSWRVVTGLSDDVDTEIVVLGGGPDLAVVGEAPRGEDEPNKARLFVSHDRGITWLARDLVESWETPVYGRQFEDGSIATIVHEGDCGGQTPHSFAFDRALAPRRSTRLALYEELAWREDAIAGPDGALGRTTFIEGPYPIVLANERAYRYANGKATPLPWTISDEISGLAADAAGRMWGIACGHVVRATRDVPRAYCD